MKKKARKRNDRKNSILTCMFIVVFFLSLILIVCQAYGDDTKNKESRVLYNDIEKTPDPFKPVIQQIVEKPKKSVEAKKAKTVPLTPLELFSIGQLKLVGITMGQGKNMAMIEDPTGKFYPITKGTLIGLKQGKVAEISPDRVVIEEKTDADEKKVNRIILELFTETSGE